MHSGNGDETVGSGLFETRDDPAKPHAGINQHDHGTGADIHQQVFYSTNYYTARSIEIVRNHTRDKPAQP